MSGIRINRFLTSTAVALFLTTSAGIALADPATETGIGAAAPDTTTATSASTDTGTSTDTDTSATAPDAATDETPTPAAAAVAPAADATAQSADKPDDTTTASTPTATPAPAPATAAVPAATPAVTAIAPVATPAIVAGPVAASVDATSSADAAIAEQLHGLSDGRFDRILGSKKDRSDIDAFYSGRSYAPLWISNGKVNAHGRAAIAYLGHVDADGLDPADYAVPNFGTLTDPAALAEAEMKLTAAVILYAHHASVGRVHWSRISPDIEFTTKPPEPADVLAQLVGATDTAAALDSYEPHAAGYVALKAKLAELRAGKTEPGKAQIANGPMLKIGAQDDRVPDLRERLGVLGDGGTTYDKALADAVKKFQEGHELKATGLLTTQTVEALNGRQPDHPTDIILANLERWRWMPHDLGSSYVIVNLPDFTLRVVHDGKQIWMTKVVIGKPDKATPLMSAEMKYITVNPTWNVPPSIVNNEYLPALAQDPTVLERMGLKVSHNPDGSIHISQPPGDRNALGRIRFNFPNKFLVYQHDTPDKYMFAYDKRALSHGCMRVFEPAKYAEVLLSFEHPEGGYSEERIKRMYGPEEINIQFPASLPVHLTYQTAFVDDAGKLQFRDDVYGRDRALLALLKGSGDDRRVADVAVEHKDNVTRRQALAIPDSPTLWGGRSYGARNGGGGYTEGQNFFSQLFGGAFASAPPQPIPGKPGRQRRTELR